MKQGVNPQTIKGMVNNFLVWRAANSVDWDCTVTDLVEETGLSMPTVISVLNRKGWRHRVNNNPHGNVDRLSVDEAMRNPYARILARF